MIGCKAATRCVAAVWLWCGVLLAQDFSPAPYPQNESYFPAANQGTSYSQEVSGQVFEPCQILATVGDQFILAADVMPHVNQILAPHLSKIPADMLPEQRRGITAQLTRSHVETKLLYLTFLRKIPPDKVKEIHKRVEASFDEEFEEERRNVEKMNKEQQAELLKRNPQIARMVLLMKERGVWTQRELDVILREFGGSLTQEKAFYVEHKLGRAVVSQNIKFQPDITYDELLKYYGEQEKKYSFPHRARFEVLTVKLSNFPIARRPTMHWRPWEIEVYYGANFAAVAKRSSQGLNAEQGGITTGPLAVPLFPKCSRKLFSHSNLVN